MKKSKSLLILSVFIFAGYLVIFGFWFILFDYLPESGPSRTLIIINNILSVIDIIILMLICWIMITFSKTKNIEVFEKQPNPQLDLYLDSVFNVFKYVITLLFGGQTVLGIARFVISVIVSWLQYFEVDNYAKVRMLIFLCLYSGLLAVIGCSSFFEIMDWQTKALSMDDSDVDISLEDKEELSQIKMTAFFNRTRYMLSSYGGGHITGIGSVFVDIENEIEQIYDNTEEVRSYLMGLDNYIFIIDCDDVFSSENRYGIPAKNKYDSIEELIGTIEDEYAKLSPLSTLTVGVLHVPDELTANKIRNCFRYPCNIIFMESIYNIDPLLFVRTPREDMFYLNRSTDEDGKELISEAIANGKAVNFKDLWALLEHESDYRVDFSQCNNYFIAMIKEMIFEQSDIRRVMFGFDCLEFMMRVIAIDLWVRNNGTENPEKYDVPTSFSGIASQIMNNISPDDPQYGSVVSVCKLTDAAQKCLKEVCIYYGYAADGDEYDLCGIVTLLKEIRNKTRGHGIINKNNSGIVWNFLVCMIYFISRFLKIEDFTFEISGKDVFCGYCASICNVSPLILADNEMPCIPVSVTNSNKRFGAVKQYMNFFNGKYIKPDLVDRL